jgi:DNA-binding NarL/FixJ family response regulator
MQRLVVVAESSLILEAISIGLRQSGEFKLLGHVDGRRIAWRAIVDADPDVVLIDEMDHPEEALEAIRRIKAERPEIAVIALTTGMDSAWLDGVFEAGAIGAISKATHPVALVTLVRETARGHVIHRYERLAQRPSGLAPNLPVSEDSALTGRELEVLRLVAAGSTNSEIARSLWVTQQTVKFHLSNVYRKLEVANRTEASHFAHINGLVTSPSMVVAS